MSTQDLNYEQPTVSDAAVDNSDDYTEYTFSTTKGMRFALIVTYIQYTILAKNDCMESRRSLKKQTKCLLSDMMIQPLCTSKKYILGIIYVGQLYVAGL